MALETRELLTVYPMSVAAFAMPNTQIVLKSINVNDHSAWAFPGMMFSVNVAVPSGRGWSGYKSISYAFSSPFIDTDAR